MSKFHNLVHSLIHTCGNRPMTFDLLPIEEQQNQTVEILVTCITDLDLSLLFSRSDLNGRQKTGGEVPFQVRQETVFFNRILPYSAIF